jgi:hypothetical protein
MKMSDVVLEKWLTVQEKQLEGAKRGVQALKVMAATGAVNTEAAGMAWRNFLPGTPRDLFGELMMVSRSGIRKGKKKKETEEDDKEDEMEGVVGPSGASEKE